MSVGLGVVERRLTKDLQALDQEVAFHRYMDAEITELVRVELSFFIHPSELQEVEQMTESMLEHTGAEIERWTNSKTLVS